MRLEELRSRSQEALDSIQKTKELLAQAHKLLEENNETGVLQVVQEVLALDSQNTLALQLKQEIAVRSENREREQKVLVLLAAAQEAHQAGNFESCLRSTRKALALAPDHPEVRELDRLAIEALERNRRVEALLKKAQRALQAKDYPSAAETAQKVLDLQPQDQYALQICREAAEALERQKRISELLQEAQEYYGSQDYENCLKASQEGLQIDPRHAELRKLRKQAQEILEKSLKIEQLLAEAREALKDDDYSVAQKRARGILKLESDHPEALKIDETAAQGARRQQQLNKILASAQQSLKKGEFQNCLEGVQEGLKVEPQNEGLLRLQEQAQEALERLQKIDELFEQAQRLLKQKQDDPAMEKVREILSLDPENVQAIQLRKKAVARLEAREKEERVSDLLAQAEEAYQQGEFKTCLQATAEALVLAPAHPETKTLDQKAREAYEKEQQVEDLLARVHRFRTAENYRAALEATEQALALQPDLGELQEIRDSITKALSHQETVKKLRTKARDLYESGDYHGCLKACDEGLKLEPEERDLLRLNQLAAEAIKQEKRLEDLLEQSRQALDQGDFSRALGFSEQALTIDPNHGEALQMQKGAKQEAERRQKLDSFLFSARRLFEAKEYSKCVQAVESGLKLDRENSELSELLERAQQSLDKQLRIGELLSQARELFKGAKDREVVVTAKELLALDPKHSEGLQLLEKAQARIRARERRERVDQLLEKVRRSYQASEYQKCLEASKEALALEPDSPEVTEFQVKAQEKLEQSERQGRLLEAAGKKLEAKDFGGAIDQAQAVLLLNPGQPDALKIQQKAEEGLERQRRGDEYLTSAEAAFEAENYKACLEAAAQGLEVQPEQVRFKQLQRLAGRALQKREKTMSSLLDKARRQLKLENFRKALTLTQDILALDPDHREAIEIQETAKDGIERLGPDAEPGLWEYASRPIAILAAILIMVFAVYQLFIAPARELSTLVALAQESFEAGEYPAAQLRITEGLNLDPEQPDLLLLDVEVKKALAEAAVPTVPPGILSLN